MEGFINGLAAFNQYLPAHKNFINLRKNIH